MSTRRLERRTALRLAGIMGAGLGAGLVPMMARADAGTGPEGIEGAWLITVQPQGGPDTAPYEVLNLYTLGGGVAGSSAHDPTTGNGVFGAWARQGDKFEITFVGFNFSTGGKEWLGTLKVQARATLSRDRRHISGPARVSVFAPDGAFLGGGPTSFEGTRIQVEPL